jgi:acyl-CoA hydrolase
MSQTHPRRSFAVVVPAFDEVENVPALYAELRGTFTRHGLEGQVILVDDGSTDGTGEAARREAGGDPRFLVLTHRRNRGKTEAMLTAAAATDARYLVLFDADLQHSTEEIPRFLEKLAEGWDVVTGRKVGRYEKRWVSAIYNRLSRLLFRVPVRDLNSMKAFRRDILGEIPLRHDWHRFFAALAHARGHSITEIDIELHPRRAGISKYAGSGRIVWGMYDLAMVWCYMHASERPMRLLGGVGMIAATLSIGVAAATVAMRASGVILPIGYRPLLLLVALLALVGVVLVCFAFIGETLALLIDTRREPAECARCRAGAHRGGSREQAGATGTVEGSHAGTRSGEAPHAHMREGKTMSQMEPRSPSETEAVLAELTLPMHGNNVGTVFGGALLSLVDRAAGVASARHASRPTVTAAIERVDFRDPIRVGELVTCRARVTYVGRSSMEVVVQVTAEDITTGRARLTNECVLTMVAVDSGLRPQPVPRLRLETEDDRRRFRDGEIRRAARKRLEEELARNGKGSGGP